MITMISLITGKYKAHRFNFNLVEIQLLLSFSRNRYLIDSWMHSEPIKNTVNVAMCILCQKMYSKRKRCFQFNYQLKEGNEILLFDTLIFFINQRILRLECYKILIMHLLSYYLIHSIPRIGGLIGFYSFTFDSVCFF